MEVKNKNFGANFGVGTFGILVAISMFFLFIGSAVADCTDVGIFLNKTANATEINYGESVNYTYLIENCEEGDIGNISLFDDKLGVILCPKTTLFVNEMMICYADANLTENTTNTATVTGTVYDDTVSANDTATVMVIINPAISIDKKANASVINYGDSVKYTYNVTNIGNVPLNNITVSDDKCSSVMCSKNTLTVGESMICTCVASLIQNTTNIAIASGTGPNGETVSASDTETVIVIMNPAISIDKTANASVINYGDSVKYTYNVTNIGNVPLNNVTVSDDKCAPLNCPKNTLVAGESMLCNCSTTITQTTTNIAVVYGTAPNGENVSAQDNETVIVKQKAAMRTIGFWKHQFAVATGNNKGKAQINSAILQSYLPIDVFGNKIKTLDDGYKTLWIRKASMKERAIQQCFATLLNFKNGAATNDSLVDTNYDKIADMKFSDAINTALSEFNGGNYEKAKNVCDSINNMDE
ncbi:MAG: hypothetical protein CVT89_01185 [Candidatus Altiarchaeales archaeon HGW-Altiarchaeales-2]|nr:MAG: hypothetical protein CVT89_01185 [Candidatus Altiarchaeales archaeon HGW-Altiarchaeales-2]